MKFHEKLYTLRRSADMTQADLAEKLNVSRQAVSRWEMGTAMPDVDNLIAISDLFGVTLDDLLKNKEDSQDGEIPPPKEKCSRYWDFVPKKWWLPLAGIAILKILWVVYAVLMQCVPEFSISMNQWINKNAFTQSLFMAFSPFYMFSLPRFLGAITAGCFIWALVKWLKARK